MHQSNPGKWAKDIAIDSMLRTYYQFGDSLYPKNALVKIVIPELKEP